MSERGSIDSDCPSLTSASLSDSESEQGFNISRSTLSEPSSTHSDSPIPLVVNMDELRTHVDRSTHDMQPLDTRIFAPHVGVSMQVQVDEEGVLNVTHEFLGEEHEDVLYPEDEGSPPIVICLEWDYGCDNDDEFIQNINACNLQ